MLEIFLSAFVSFFVIVDPIGTAAIFAGLTKNQPLTDKRSIALKAVVIATAILFFFGLVGKNLIGMMGISIDAFRIAGGLLLFVTAFRMIMGDSSADSVNVEHRLKNQSHFDLAVFPLAIPLLAGPGCMTATILHMNQVTAIPEKLLIGLAIVIVEIIAYICLLSASHLTALVGRAGTSLLSKVMGVLLAALAVQFIADGVLALFKGSFF